MINSKNKRLILSLVCLFSILLFTGTESTGCFDCSGESTNGTVLIQNSTSLFQLKIVIAGPSSSTFLLSIGYQKSISIKSGSYTVVAYTGTPPWYNSEYFSTSFTIAKGESKTISIH